jgi:Cation transport ATPase
VALFLPLPITAAQILWLNLITDGFLDTALSAEKTEADIIKPNGFKRSAKIIDIKLMYKVFYMALPMGIASIAIFYYYYPYDIVHARTITLVTMAMFQWFNAFNCRSEKKSVFELGFFSNKWLLLAISTVFALQFLVVYNPVMQKIFGTSPITAAQWGLVLLVSSSVFFIEEIRKFLVSRFYIS